MIPLGDFLDTETVYCGFSTFGGSAESITITGLAVTDIEVYKDGSMTQRTSDNGYTLLDTDGIDLDLATGIHGFSIDLSDNSDAGFYADGSQFRIVVDAITVNAQTVRFQFSFSIGRLLHPTTAGRTLDIQSTGEVDANITLISGNATPGTNLGLQYDGTGLTGDTFPATQSQIGGIANVGSAVHRPASSYVLTTGTQSANTVSETEALDETRHEHTDTAGVMELYYEFIIGAGIPSSCQVTGYVTGNNDDLDVYGFDWVTSAWVQIGNIQGGNSTSNSVFSFDMFINMVGSGANEGIVRVRFFKASGLTTALLAIDQIFISFSQEAGEYENAAVWFDSSASNTNTVVGIDGRSRNPVSSEAAVNTLLASTNLKRVEVKLDSSITFTTSHTSEEWHGRHWTLALGGQDISSSHFIGAQVSGIGTGTSEIDFATCEIGTATIHQFHMDNCGLGGTLTLGEAANFVLNNCHSEIAGVTTPIIDMGAAIANVNLSMPDYHNGIEIRNLNATGVDNFSISGIGQIIYAASSSGAVNQRGDWKVTNTGGVTITPDDNTTNVAAILVDTAEIGVQGAGLSNIPWNPSWDAEVQSEVADALAVFWTSPATLVDLIYDEVNTGATHGGANTGGKQWRQAATTGLYEGGQIWIDTVNGSAGTDEDENGTMDNPSSNIADATTLLTAKGHGRFKIAPGSSFTLTQAYTNIIFEGDNGAAIALGGQAITGCVFRRVVVTGIATGAGTIKFDNCLIGTSVLTCTLPPCHIDNSKIINDITSNAAGDYFFDKCSSGMAGTATWTFDFGGAIGNTNLNTRAYSGGIQLENMGDVGTDIASIEGWGQIIEGTCVGGAVTVRGNFTRSFLVTDNITWDEDARIDTLQINAQADLALSDYDGPTNAEMIARTRPTADYFDQTTDNVKLASDGLDLIVPAESGTPPVIGTSSVVVWFAHWGALSENEINQDSDSTDVRNAADTATLVTYATSDTGVIFTSGKGT